MAETVAPVFRVENAAEAVSWYRRLGFEVLGEHRFEADLPLYVFLRRGDVHLHLSEHVGDAPVGSLAYLYLDDIDAIATEFGVPVQSQTWGRDLEVVDPWGNRLRMGVVENQ